MLLWPAPVQPLQWKWQPTARRLQTASAFKQWRRLSLIYCQPMPTHHQSMFKVKWQFLNQTKLHSNIQSFYLSTSSRCFLLSAGLLRCASMLDSFQHSSGVYFHLESSLKSHSSNQTEANQFNSIRCTKLDSFLVVNCCSVRSAS